ncbi:MAG: hypothetical protein PHW04_13145 [Candidatus Wallbacteria bacterium]|nr:hypothetical protein [Candidatus Wallbacteria bacterium]
MIKLHPDSLENSNSKEIMESRTIVEKIAASVRLTLLYLIR